MKDYKLLKSYINEIKFIYDSFDTLNKVLGMGPDNIIYEFAFKLVDPLVKLLDLYYESDNWIEWYVYDNNFGTAELDAVYNENTRKIENIEDLITLIKERQNESK